MECTNPWTGGLGLSNFEAVNGGTEPVLGYLMLLKTVGDIVNSKHNTIDTTIKHTSLGQPTPMVKGRMDICVIY